ncbi:hypothetical protein AMTR_s00177p00052240 [Amborella trichopoda]|uniref:Uncharacterized protein n=1 Tax=Amborella trichopoda TaxID=13333 RepID=W1PRH2_AMBTC|nr:hypothetical protein AMTR_s00177p00052240 [Amborella trichopoda]
MSMGLKRQLEPGKMDPKLQQASAVQMEAVHFRDANDPGSTKLALIRSSLSNLEKDWPSIRAIWVVHARPEPGAARRLAGHLARLAALHATPGLLHARHTIKHDSRPYNPIKYIQSHLFARNK